MMTLAAATFKKIFAAGGESVKEIRLSNPSRWTFFFLIIFFSRSRNADPWRWTALLTALTWRDRHQAAYSGHRQVAAILLRSFLIFYEVRHRRRRRRFGLSTRNNWMSPGLFSEALI